MPELHARFQVWLQEKRLGRALPGQPAPLSALLQGPELLLSLVSACIPITLVPRVPFGVSAFQSLLPAFCFVVNSFVWITPLVQVLAQLRFYCLVPVFASDFPTPFGILLLSTLTLPAPLCFVLPVQR